ncbi:MAG: response regulator transcription factor [Burkholderiales bacterium]|nr:response regulator transcription factor [Burkholderiales bacterium]ODU62738.1 MAG: hypothetical protein ABT05_07100 [Lautropia sp. SCN 66-9]
MTASAFALIVEDLPDVRHWLQDLLQQAFPGLSVTGTATLAEARRWLADGPAARAPDDPAFRLALIDIGLPDGSGIDLISEISLRHPQTLCVVTTVYDDDEHLFPAIAAGARGYLLKDQEPEQLVRALRRIDDGMPPLSPSIARRMLEWFGQRQPLAATDGAASPQATASSQTAPSASAASASSAMPERLTALTPRETDVLSAIGRGLRVAEVARLLGLTEHTVTSYVKSLYRKLNISSRAEAALEASRRGLV